MLVYLGLSFSNSVTCIIFLSLLCFAIWYETMCEAEASRFREAKTVVEEEGLVEKAIPTSTRFTNKWAVTIFNEWQTGRKVQVPVLDCGGVFISLITRMRCKRDIKMGRLCTPEVQSSELSVGVRRSVF